ncbi:hypothetical protein HXA34_20165 [Salipaludibacillus agaradhaerens]|nr:hypothetical protein [Salipaludibacillus agaradhaerens]
MKTTGQEHLEVLENLLAEAKNGDKHGIKPDLTEKEIEAIQWSISKIKY